MRINAAIASAILSFLAFNGHVFAQDADPLDASPASLAETATSSVAEKPTFTVRSRVTVISANAADH